eukprot:gene7724-895_t
MSSPPLPMPQAPIPRLRLNSLDSPIDFESDLFKGKPMRSSRACRQLPSGLFDSRNAFLAMHPECIMFPTGPNWSQLVPNLPNSSQSQECIMFPTGPNWFQLVPYLPNSSQLQDCIMFPTGPNWSKSQESLLFQLQECIMFPTVFRDHATAASAHIVSMSRLVSMPEPECVILSQCLNADLVSMSQRRAWVCDLVIYIEPECVILSQCLNVESECVILSQCLNA